MKTIEDIIEGCGGRDAIASSTDGLSPDAVRKWASNGIPEKRWDTVMTLHRGRLSANMLHELNKSLRESA